MSISETTDKNENKRLLYIILTIFCISLFLLTFVSLVPRATDTPAEAYSSKVYATYTSGDTTITLYRNQNWLYLTYSAVISGNGAMADYTHDGSPLYNNDKIEEVIIESGVTRIGEYTFSGCSSLTSIEIPNGVTSIGYYAFYGCSRLTSIEIPNSVSSIGYFAFDGTGWYNSQPEGLVYAGKVAYRYKGTMAADTSITLRDDTIGITGFAFEGRSELTSIIIPNSVVNIDGNPFHGCSEIKYASIPTKAISYIPKTKLETVIINGGTSIGSSAFYGCSGLTSITIGNSVTRIEHSAFYGCSGLTSITIGNSVTMIEHSAFYRCSGLTSITIGNSVQSIGYQAFYCSGLTSITIGNSVQSIGYQAFFDCFRLVEVHITSLVTWCSIYYGGFSPYDNPLYYAENLYIDGILATDITIPNSVTSISSYAFCGCSGLTSIEIPNSVTSIGSSAFYGCRGLTSIEIPNSVTSIGSSAFYGCRGLTSIEIPNSVTSISSYAFYGCSGLTSIELPNSVESIGSYVFSGCIELTSIEIPNSVESIGDGAFKGCSRLNSIMVASGNTIYHSEGNCLIVTTDKRLVTGCKNSIIPTDGSVTSIGGLAFFGCSGLTTIEIPSSVTHIGGSAFYGCEKLAEVYYLHTNSNVLEIAETAFDGVPEVSMWVERNASFDYSILINVKRFDHLEYENNTYSAYGLKYSIDEETKTASIVGYDSSWVANQTLSPNNFVEYDGKFFRLLEISDNAFSNWGTTFPTFIIPEGVIRVGKNAFASTMMADIILPKSLKEIDSSAFMGNWALSRIVFGENISTLGDNAFCGCKNLRWIVFSGDIPKTMGVNVFPTGNDLPTRIFYSGAYETWTGVEDESLSVVGWNSEGFVTSRAKEKGKEIRCDVFALDDRIYVDLKDENEQTYKDFFGNTYNTIEIGNEKKATLTKVNGEAQWIFGRFEMPSFILVPKGNGYTDYILTDISPIAFTDEKDYPGLLEIVVGNNITILSEGTFADCMSLESIIIGEEVTELGDELFKDLTLLTSVTIGNKVTTISATAFSGCIALESVIIGNSVSTIEANAFSGCTSLKELSLPASVSTIGATAFPEGSTVYLMGDMPTTVQDSYQGVTRIVYPYKHRANYQGNGVYSSAYMAEYPEEDGNNQGIHYEIKDNEAYIGDTYGLGKNESDLQIDTDNNANTSGTDFLNVIIPEYIYLDGEFFPVVGIGRYAFTNNKYLETIQIGELIESICECSFSGCSKLNTISMRSNTQNTRFVAKDGILFSTTVKNDFIKADTLLFAPMAKSFTGGEYTIPSDNGFAVATISTYAFYGNYSLRKLNLNGVSYLGEAAFRDCIALTEIEGLINVETIDAHCFRGCYSLKKVGLGGVIESIGKYAFRSCESIEEITIAEGAINYAVADNVLYEFKAGETINGVIQDDEYKLLLCAAKKGEEFTVLQDINGTSVRNIAEYAFDGSKLRKLITGDSITDIDVHAFANSYLQEIVIGKSVNFLGALQGDNNFAIHTVFENCGSLSIITVDEDNTTYCSDENGILFNADKTTLLLFPVATNRVSYTIPSAVSYIGRNAFQGNSKLQRIVIPSTVKEIGTDAFAFCEQDISIYFKGEAPIIQSNSNSDSLLFARGINDPKRTKVLYNPVYEDSYKKGNWLGYVTAPYSAISPIPNQVLETETYSIIVVDSSGEGIGDVEVTFAWDEGVKTVTSAMGSENAFYKGVASIPLSVAIAGQTKPIPTDVELSIVDNNGKYFSYYNPCFVLDAASHISYVQLSAIPTVFGVSCNNTDINSHIADVNLAEYVENTDICDNNGNIEETIVTPVCNADGEVEKLKISIIGYCDVGWQITSFTLMQDGIVIGEIEYPGGSDNRAQSHSFEITCEKLISDVPIIVYVAAENDEEQRSTDELDEQPHSYLNINVFHFALTSEDIDIVSDGLSVDFSAQKGNSAAALLSKLMGKDGMNFNIGNNANLSITSDEENVTVKLGYSKAVSEGSVTTVEAIREGYYNNHTGAVTNTFFFQYDFNKYVDPPIYALQKIIELIDKLENGIDVSTEKIEDLKTELATYLGYIEKINPYLEKIEKVLGSLSIGELADIVDDISSILQQITEAGENVDGILSDVQSKLAALKERLETIKGKVNSVLSILEKEKAKGLVFNIRFARGTEKEGYYYYRCLRKTSIGEKQVGALVFGVVKSRTLKAGLTAKTFIIMAEFIAKDWDKTGGDGYAQDQTKNREAIPNYSKGYSETISNANKASKEQSFGISVEGKLVFTYTKNFIKLTSGSITGTLTYSFKYNTQFVVWVIPITVEVKIDLMGKLHLELGFDFDAENPVSVEEASLTLSADLGLRAGIGCSAISVGVYGSLGTTFILDFVPTVKVRSWSIRGEFGVYAKFLFFEKTHQFWSGEYYIIGSKDSSGAQSIRSMSFIPSMYMSGTYVLMSDGEDDSGVYKNANPRYAIIDGELVMFYIDEVDGAYKLMYSVISYDGNEYIMSDAVILGNAEVGGKTVSEISYGLYTDSSKNCYIVYTQTAVTANSENLSEYAANAEVNVMTLPNTFRWNESKSNLSGTLSASNNRLTDNSSYEYNTGLNFVGSTPTVYWIENSDNDIYGVSPYNYTDNNGIAHIHITTANSIKYARFENNIWSRQTAADELYTVSEVVLTSGGKIVYIIDTDCDLATGDDREMYYYDIFASSGSKKLFSDKASYSSLKVIKDGEDERIVYYATLNITEESETVTKAALFYLTEPFSSEVKTNDENVNNVYIANDKFDSSVINGNYTVVLNNANEVLAILYKKEVSWMENDQNKKASTVYAIFKTSEGWGAEVQLVVPKADRYVESFDAIVNEDVIEYTVLWATFVDKKSNDNLIGDPYEDEGTVDDALCYYSFAHYNYGIKTSLTIDEEYMIDYEVLSVGFTIVNDGTSHISSVFVRSFDGEEATVKEIEVDILPGEKGQISIGDFDGNKNYVVSVFYSQESANENREAIKEFENISFKYADLSVSGKQVKLGEEEYIIVSVTSKGNQNIIDEISDDEDGARLMVYVFDQETENINIEDPNQDAISNYVAANAPNAEIFFAIDVAKLIYFEISVDALIKKYENSGSNTIAVIVSSNYTDPNTSDNILLVLITDIDSEDNTLNTAKTVKVKNDTVFCKDGTAAAKIELLSSMSVEFDNISCSELLIKLGEQTIFTATSKQLDTWLVKDVDNNTLSIYIPAEVLKNYAVGNYEVALTCDVSDTDYELSSILRIYSRSKVNVSFAYLLNLYEYTYEEVPEIDENDKLIRHDFYTKTNRRFGISTYASGSVMYVIDGKDNEGTDIRLLCIEDALSGQCYYYGAFDDPTKESDENMDYVFVGWKISNSQSALVRSEEEDDDYNTADWKVDETFILTENATFVPLFDYSIRRYEVKFVIKDEGSVSEISSTQQISKGNNPAYLGIVDDGIIGWDSDGDQLLNYWMGAPLPAVSQNVKYVAVYAKKNCTHTIEEGNTNQPSCHSATCILCGETLPATEDHIFENELTVDKEATCDENGSKSRHCSRCDAVKEITEIPGKGHVLIRVPAQEATCTEPGRIAFYNCNVCEKFYLDEACSHEIDYSDTIVAALGHDFGDWTIIIPATCTSNGTEERVCSRDATHKETRSIPMIEHNMEHNEAKAPTCTEVGWEVLNSCKICGKVECKEIPALGHTCTHTKKVEVTCTTAGNSEYWSCTRCSKLFSDKECTHEIDEKDTVIAALGHDIVQHEGKAPTCTEKGWKPYDTCSRCDYTTYEEINATGHNYVDDVCIICGDIKEDKRKEIEGKTALLTGEITDAEYDILSSIYNDIRSINNETKSKLKDYEKYLHYVQSYNEAVFTVTSDLNEASPHAGLTDVIAAMSSLSIALYMSKFGLIG